MLSSFTYQRSSDLTFVIGVYWKDSWNHKMKTKKKKISTGIQLIDHHFGLVVPLAIMLFQNWVSVAPFPIVHHSGGLCVCSAATNSACLSASLPSYHHRHNEYD